MACMFCKIAEGKMPADIIYTDDDVIGFHDIHPQAPHHILFIPRHHISTINDFTVEDASLIGKLTLAAQQTAQQQGFDQAGYRLVMNCNRMAGQSVFHVHLHLLAGRAMHWPPG